MDTLYMDVSISKIYHARNVPPNGQWPMPLRYMYSTSRMHLQKAENFMGKYVPYIHADCMMTIKLSRPAGLARTWPNLPVILHVAAASPLETLTIAGGRRGVRKLAERDSYYGERSPGGTGSGFSSLRCWTGGCCMQATGSNLWPRRPPFLFLFFCFDGRRR